MSEEKYKVDGKAFGKIYAISKDDYNAKKRVAEKLGLTKVRPMTFWRGYMTANKVNPKTPGRRRTEGQ